MNNFRTRAMVLALAIGTAPLLTACGGDDEAETNAPAAAPAPAPAQALRVTSLDLGKSVDASKRVAADTDEFTPRDTIYASVVTEGSASTGTLVARWTYQDGQVVEESSQSVSPSMSSVTEFHISKPDGFPAGNYKVEILLNGQPVESEDFAVR